MQKTDLVFYLSMSGLIATTLKDIVVAANPVTVQDWVVLILGAVGVLSYALYDKLTGTKPQ